MITKKDYPEIRRRIRDIIPEYIIYALDMKGNKIRINTEFRKDKEFKNSKYGFSVWIGYVNKGKEIVSGIGNEYFLPKDEMKSLTVDEFIKKNTKKIIQDMNWLVSTSRFSEKL